MTLRQSRQVFERREIAIHGKHAVGGDQRVGVTAAVLSQKRFGVRHVAVAIALHGRAAELGAGMDAGVGQFIDQDQVAAAGQRRDDADIGEIAGAENARRFGAFQPRQPALQFVVERVIAGDEARGAGADAVALRRLDRRFDDRGMAAKIEIIVAREREQTAAAALGENAVARPSPPACGGAARAPAPQACRRRIHRASASRWHESAECRVIPEKISKKWPLRRPGTPTASITSGCPMRR